MKQVILFVALLTIIVLTGCVSTSSPEENTDLWLQPRITGLSDDIPGVPSFFGRSVAIDGEVAVVGLPLGNNKGGVANVYIREGNGWILQQKLIPSNGGGNLFSLPVAISGDTILVATNSVNGMKGAVCVFVRKDSVWEEQGILKASDARNRDMFGSTLDIKGDTAIIGAPEKNRTGMVYIFQRSGTRWEEVQKLVSQTTTKRYFGGVVKLYKERAYVLSILEEKGTRIHIFKNTETGWIEEQQLTAHDATVNDLFGCSIAFSDDFLIAGSVSFANDLSTGEVYVFSWNNSKWEEVQKIIPPDGMAGDYFGSSVGILDNYAFVGAPGNDSNGEEAGVVYVYYNNGNEWIYHNKLTAPQPAPGEEIGDSLFVSGNTVITGNDQDSSLGGKVYLFTDQAVKTNEPTPVPTTTPSPVPTNLPTFEPAHGPYEKEIKITATDGVESDRFGEQVAISPDGNTVLAGAPNGFFNEASPGAAYLYRWNKKTWVETKLTASDRALGDTFGYGVCLAHNGTMAIIGSPHDDDNGKDSGSAYMYVWNGNEWEEIKLIASDGAEGDDFGRAVALSEDGNTAAVGAPGDINDTGSVYIYKWDGDVWKETKITASDKAVETIFGLSVALSQNGNMVVIGARGDHEAERLAGAVYIYQWNGTRWVESKITASDAASLDGFGHPVSVSHNGDTIAVGAVGDSDGFGSVYIYRQNGTTWNETEISGISYPGSGYLGVAISLSPDGSTFARGVFRGIGDTGMPTGYVNIHKWNGTTWKKHRLSALNLAQKAHYGRGVALSADGKTIVAGAPHDDEAGKESGSIYIYKLKQLSNPGETIEVSYYYGKYKENKNIIKTVIRDDSYDKRVSVFKNKPATISDKPYAEFELPEKIRTKTKDIILELEAFNDDNAYSRSIGFYIDGKGGYIGTLRTAPSQVKGDITLSPNSTGKWKISLSRCMVAAKEKGGEVINLLEYIKQPGKHTLGCWVTTDDTYGPQSWVSVDLVLKIDSPGEEEKEIPHSLQDGLVAYYPFDSDARDNSGNNNHGTIHGATLLKERNGCCSFDGNDHLQFSSPVQYQSPFSVSFWLKFDEIPAQNAYLMSNGGQTRASQGFYFLINQSSQLEYGVANQKAEFRNGVRTVLENGKWHHVTGTWDGSPFTYNILLYINGQKIETEKMRNWGNFDKKEYSPDNLRIGAPSNNLAYFVRANLDNIRIYDRVLTDSEVAGIYNKEKSVAIQFIQEVKTCTTSSYIDYENMYLPSTVFDNNPETGWLESADGPGNGQYIAIEFEQKIIIDEIKIMPGYFDKKWWEANNRVKQMKIQFDDCLFYVDFKDVMKEQSIPLLYKVSFQKAVFTIMDVYVSNKDNDAGISEIGFYYKNKKIDVRLPENLQEQENSTPHLSMNEYVYSHVWSPDGEKIAYTIPTDASDISKNLHLVIANKDLSDPQIIYTGLNSVQISWQGDWILFEMDKEKDNPGSYYGAQEYWKIRSDGSDLTQLTFTFTNGIKYTENGSYNNCGSARWASFVKGTNLIYFRAHNGNGWYKSYVCNADGTDDWQEVSGTYTGATAVSPLGTTLMYMIGSNYNQPHKIMVKNNNGEGKVFIADVSARGYFFANADDSKVIWHDNGNIYTADMNGANQRLVLKNTQAVNPLLDPEEILCKKQGHDGYYHIYKVNLTDSSIVQLTSGSVNDAQASINPVYNCIAVRRDYHDSGMRKLEILSLTDYVEHSIDEDKENNPQNEIQSVTLIGYYPFEGNARDSSNNQNHGKEYNGVSYKPGIKGQAASFDGIDDFIEITPGSNVSGIRDFTISVWTYVTGWQPETNRQYVFDGHSHSQKAITDYYRPGFCIIYDKKNGNEIHNAIYYDPDYLEQNTPLSVTGKWIHHVFVRKGKEDNTYINGSPIKVSYHKYDKKNDSLNMQHDWYIGAFSGNNKNYNDSTEYKFWGLIDELRIYEGALTEEEIKILFLDHDKEAELQIIQAVRISGR